MTATRSLALPSLPQATERRVWGCLAGAARGLAIAESLRHQTGFSVLVAADMAEAYRIEQEVRFFLPDPALPVLVFPDWETLPYDVFSPHQDIVSQRLGTLYRLPGLTAGVLILPVSTLMQRLPPPSYLETHALMLDVGERLDPEAMRNRLEASGYRCVSEVQEHGEFAVRGALLDLFPMGSELPYRIDLFDEEVESIRTFDPDTQRTLEKVDAVRLLPAREFPLDEDGIRRFRQAFRVRFSGNPSQSSLYRAISEGFPPGGAEYYLPLFFEQTATLFDYLPDNTLLWLTAAVPEATETFWQQIHGRHDQRRHDPERPVLDPDDLYLSPADLKACSNALPRVILSQESAGGPGSTNIPVAPPHDATGLGATPAERLVKLRADYPGRLLLVAETAGRREVLLERLNTVGLKPELFPDWHGFLHGTADFGIVVAELEEGLRLQAPDLSVVTELHLLGERAPQRRRRRDQERDAEQVIRDLSELQPGAPVVHVEHGVGRYLGLQTLESTGTEAEFLTLEYAQGDRLYVPVASLHLISRYTGASPETAPLHRLGSDQWNKARRRAAERARDVAAELLDVYAKRAARQGYVYPLDREAYDAFADAFPFEETPDQEAAIQQVLEDLQSRQPMDRLVCGDVGFGKTEVAMRAAFVAAHAGKQVAVLVPTTLLAQQHYQNFRDRFADSAVRVESLSRMTGSKDQDRILADIAAGTVDIAIGTHKLLSAGVRFKDLGLVIIDEEHRFGVRQKERLKALRSEVDVLTLTATPIPRTLNMSLSGLRDLSIIATPPAKRLTVKTFVTEWDDALVQEACLRELKRGGQVYVLHNEVKSIERFARRVAELVPQATVRIAHGQMSERELERVMLDFYHQRFNVLVCTTIIESGIDVPTANTIIINRADRLGLAQLHQLRGRVGRSHHRAYAYLVAPPRAAMTADAEKRLEAVASLGELGVGFTLATHDLEIRGAGELLGQGQSGQIQEVGFQMYRELLDRAVRDLKAGRQPDPARPLDQGPEVDLHVPALIPDDYLPDIHARLILYKRIASAEDDQALHDLQVEMIDRFGLLPPAVKNLFRVTTLKLQAEAMAIHKIDVGAAGGRLTFGPEPRIDPLRLVQLVQSDPQTYQLSGTEKLLFKRSMEHAEARADAVETVLNAIRPQPEQQHAQAGR